MAEEFAVCDVALVAAGEGEGALALPAATALTMASEALAERAGLCDYGIKSSRQAAHLWHSGEKK